MVSDICQYQSSHGQIIINLAQLQYIMTVLIIPSCLNDHNIKSQLNVRTKYRIKYCTLSLIKMIMHFRVSSHGTALERILIIKRSNYNVSNLYIIQGVFTHCCIGMMNTTTVVKNSILGQFSKVRYQIFWNKVQYPKKIVGRQLKDP